MINKLDKLKRGSAYHTGQTVEKNTNPQIRIDKLSESTLKSNKIIEKTANETNEAIKDLETTTNESIDILKVATDKALKELMDYVNSPNYRFVIGQYLWTHQKGEQIPPTPKGWIRISKDLATRGMTLLADYSSIGTAYNTIQTGHAMEFTQRIDLTYSYTENQTDYLLLGSAGATSGAIATGGRSGAWSGWNGKVGSAVFPAKQKSDTTVPNRNYPAGIYAALWYFVGVGEDGETNPEPV